MKFLKVLSFCSALFVCLMGVVQAETLSGDKLRETVTGKTVYLSVAMGVELPIRYRAGGAMTGKVTSLIKLVQANAPLSDKGKWWIKGDQLCQKWSQWLEGQSYCYRLKKAGGQVVWHRNDGKSGTARISD